MPWALAAGLAAAMAVHGPIAQLDNYHDFADRRALWGIANAADVLSNAGFAIVGAWGCWVVGVRKRHESLARSWPAYGLLMVALVLTAFGSAYYHLAPDNERLLWDRLPIGLASGALLAAVYADTHQRPAAAPVTLALGAAGVASVLWWYFTDRAGVGDLRAYLYLQALAIVLIPLWQALARAPRADRLAFALAIALYVLAKACELGDRTVFTAIGFMSGHTAKHLLAIAAGAVIVARLASRSRPAAGSLRRDR